MQVLPSGGEPQEEARYLIAQPFCNHCEKEAACHRAGRAGTNIYPACRILATHSAGNTHSSSAVNTT